VINPKMESTTAVVEPFSQLEAKLLEELNSNHPYEALQYVQSFVARKKKVLGQNVTSALVFHGAKLLSEHGASSSAGTLLKWFIEDGAGVDYLFKLQKNPLDDSNYCDVLRLSDFLTEIKNLDDKFNIINAIYGPLHILISKTKITQKSELSKRIFALEKLFANIFDSSSKWVNAFKSYLRVEDIGNAAIVLNKWSSEGYATEKPLFFARILIHLLSEKRIVLARELLSRSVGFVDDNTVNGKTGGGPLSASLAIWHLSVILTDLATLPPMQRVDKAKLFGLLSQQYMPLLIQIDNKLVDVFYKAGEVSFGYAAPELNNNRNQAPNPMAMLQGLLSAGGGGSSSSGKGQQPDFSGMMNMLSRMQG
jgi:hypothetical protein